MCISSCDVGTQNEAFHNVESCEVGRTVLTSSTPTATTASNVGPAKHANGNKRPTPIIIYPTVTPESIVVPIVSCIFGFPLLALTVICCLRRRAKLARERARRRNCELDRGELSVVRLSPVKSKPRAVSLVRSPRAPPILELDTVLEERSDPEQTTLSQIVKWAPYCLGRSEQWAQRRQRRCARGTASGGARRSSAPARRSGPRSPASRWTRTTLMMILQSTIANSSTSAPSPTSASA
ncbi:hypothetical protein O3G_MSEX005060 [Manduca sexta]|uniref:Uncharacterized protein n=1 Tax=Manduca sexta TaxID=7130 RepID=A0A921YX43_MANSE|nr:hypothetical protein O3G_MSEX005060 [Manduca sexta]